MLNLRISAIIAAGLLAGCDQSSVPSALEDGSGILSATESFRDFGDWTVHVNALVTDQLSAEVASQYDITRSSGRAMLNVSAISNASGNGLKAEVSVSASNLSAQLRNLTMREIAEGEAVYYIGETPITNAETLIFTINITPEGMGPQSLRYMQQFYVD